MVSATAVEPSKDTKATKADVESLWDSLFTTRAQKQQKQQLRDMAALSPEGRQRKKQEVLDWIGALKDPLAMKEMQAANMAAQIAGLAKWEFITRSVGGLAMLAKGKLLERSAKTFREQVIADLIKLNAQLANARTDADLNVALAGSEAVGTACLKAIEEMSKTLTGLGDAAAKLIEDKAVQAWVRANPDNATKFIGYLQTVADGTLSLGTDTLPPGYKSVGAAAEAAKASLDRAIKNLNEVRQAKDFNKANIKGAAFDKLDQDPALMAKSVADECKANFDLLLAYANIGMVNVPGWSELISPAVEVCAHGYFDGRVKKLEDKLAKARAEPKVSLQAKVKEVITESVKDIKDSLLTELLKVVGQVGLASLNLTAVVISWVKAQAEKMVAAIVKRLPIDPAQAVSGDDLRQEITGLSQSTRTTYHRTGTAQKDEEFPTETADGKKVDLLLTVVPETDDTGRFVWAKVDGAQGRLYLADKTFEPEYNSDLAGVPERDKDGRPVLQVRGKEGAMWRVQIGDMVGYLDPNSEVFLAEQPAGYANWSNRKVALDGYTENGRKVTGTWYQPIPGRDTYLFVGSDGKREWAGSGADTANVKGSARYSIREVFGDKVSRSYPGKL